MGRLQVKGWAGFQHYKDRSPAWIKLHRGILDDFDFAMLPLASKALAPLIWLLASESEDGSVDADVRKIAFRLRWNESDVIAGLKPLISSGFLIDASNALAERYQPDSLEREGYREEEEEEKEEKPSLRSGSIAPAGADRPLEKKNSSKKLKPKNGPVAYSPEFEIFWECYPPVENQSKAKAHEAFSRLDKPDRSTAIDGALALMKWLEAEIQRKPDAGKFIPHASTWLNQRRWETLLEPNHRSRYEQRPEVH